MGDRFTRNVALFGDAGQQRLRSMSVAVVGVGGLGTHVVQQVALLGVGAVTLIDPEQLEDSNRNRYVGALATDPVPGLLKVDLGERLILGIDPKIVVTKVADSFVSEAGFDALRSIDYVFGCLDSDGSRLILNEFCSAYSKSYIDLATEVVPGPPLQYGGRVLVNLDGDGCLVCLDELDVEEAGRELAGPAEAEDRNAIYGVKGDLLARGGPSVVSLNGVVASLGVMEFMAAATGLRRPQKLLTYYGHDSIVRRRVGGAAPDCWYCTHVRGQGRAADVERFLELA